MLITLSPDRGKVRFGRMFRKAATSQVRRGIVLPVKQSTPSTTMRSVETTGNTSRISTLMTCMLK
ncbi:MAG: hypothetical protein IKU22_09145 [Alistipes sp.]|nr:hypothetical protein [Alistipes sp.]